MTVRWGLPSRGWGDLGALLDYVRGIVEDVKRRGDAALLEYTKRFDGIEIESVTLGKGDLDTCASKLPDEVTKAIEIVYEAQRKVCEASRPRDLTIFVGGVRMVVAWKPIERVGLYVPGGRKAYPSTAIMLGVPARTAGVHEIYLASPPRPDGCIDPAIAYVAKIVGVRRVYRVGGPQVIAALAYGTESVVKVDKIVGPGNMYVQAAKMLVQDVVAIDGVAGPTELVAVADESADPRLVALDLMAQAEHGRGSTVALVTTSRALAEGVSKLLEGAEGDYYVHVVRDLSEALRVVNEMAPEHVALHVRDPGKLIDLLLNAGAVTVGQTPSALVDYLGPNHVLPTSGWARSRGVLSVYDFVKPVALVEGVGELAEELLWALEVLARYEGFHGHAESVRARYVRAP